MSDLELSAIVVVGDRHDGVRDLFLDYWQALTGLGLDFELIYVLDGNYREVLAELQKLQEQGYAFSIYQLARGFSESAALNCGFDHATGKNILLLPAYYQIEPREISKLLASAVDADMVVPRRWPRRAGRLENLRRRAFHGLLRWVTGSRFRDLGCNVRLLDRRILEDVHVFGDQHRFLPFLAHSSGFRVKEIDVTQSARDEFRGRYRWREYLHRVLDIFTVFFLVRFTKKPLRFFGMIGSILLGVGGVALLVVVTERLFFGVALADRPALLLSSLMVVLGLQIISLGLLGELIIFTHAPALKEYKIAEIIEHRESEKAVPVDSALKTNLDTA